MSAHGPGSGKIGGVLGTKKQKTRPVRILMKELAKYLKGFVGLLILVAIISIAYGATQLINPLILSTGIDAINPESIVYRQDWGYIVTMQDGSYWTLRLVILVYGGIFLAMGAIGFLLQSFATRLFTRVNASMINDIRLDLYNKLIFSSMSYLKKEQSGNITARITSDTTEIGTGIQVVVNVGIQFILLIATLVLLVTRTGWQITLITIGTIPVALLLSLFFSKVGRRIILKIRQAFGEISGKMAEGIAGVAVSKSFNREEEQAEQMRELNQMQYKMMKKFALMAMMFFPLIGMIASVATGAILWTAGALSMTAGEIFLGITLANQFLMPVMMLLMSFPQLQSALGALDRVLDVLEATPAIADKEDAVELKSGNRSVTFDNVTFAYEPGIEVIKNVSFKANNGELVALVGHTGAGKTTIASMLLTRFYDIDKGSIKIGEQDIRDLTQHSLRQSLGLIPQEPYLFTSTIMDNMRYGKSDATDEEIYTICKLIGADAFIDALPQGYDTVVREGGKQLSAGQRQMITIARTMLADPEILILDEATSRLDAYTESLVQEAQEQLFKGRTTFVIAHRLSTIHNAEKIIVLDHGELIEEGNHNELMALNGTYADVYRTYYAFQGLEEIDLEAFADEDEEVELGPLAMLEHGMLNKEKINTMMAEGKISPEMMAKMKKQSEGKDKKK